MRVQRSFVLFCATETRKGFYPELCTTFKNGPFELKEGINPLANVCFTDSACVAFFQALPLKTESTPEIWFPDVANEPSLFLQGAPPSRIRPRFFRAMNNTERTTQAAYGRRNNFIIYLRGRRTTLEFRLRVAFRAASDAIIRQPTFPSSVIPSAKKHLLVHVHSSKNFLVFERPTLRPPTKRVVTSLCGGAPRVLEVRRGLQFKNS